jgi:hypothetical protein
MKYTVEIGSVAMIRLPSFTKITSARRDGDRISILYPYKMEVTKTDL